MQLHVYEPLNDAELEEIERYTSEALGYRHQPEFVNECARLIAEVKRLRELQEGRRWSFARFGMTFAAPRWLSGLKVYEGGGAQVATAEASTERRLGWL